MPFFPCERIAATYLGLDAVSMKAVGADEQAVSDHDASATTSVFLLSGSSSGASFPHWIRTEEMLVLTYKEPFPEPESFLIHGILG